MPQTQNEEQNNKPKLLNGLGLKEILLSEEQHVLPDENLTYRKNWIYSFSDFFNDDFHSTPTNISHVKIHARFNADLALYFVGSSTVIPNCYLLSSQHCAINSS